MPRPFLTARWLDLCILSYPVDDAMLTARLPSGLELDRWEGSAYVSIVGFRFTNCRVKGIAWPGYGNFPEINLRFYVRRKLSDGTTRRGVMFIREYVPKGLISLIARRLYNEPYRTAPMRSFIEENKTHRSVQFDLGLYGQTHSIKVTGQCKTVEPPPDSVKHFFKEHQWGYGLDHQGRLLEYEVNFTVHQAQEPPTIGQNP